MMMKGYFLQGGTLSWQNAQTIYVPITSIKATRRHLPLFQGSPPPPQMEVTLLMVFVIAKNRETYRAVYSCHLPRHRCPSPTYPSLQAQKNEPAKLMQSDSGLQPRDSGVCTHSSMSATATTRLALQRDHLAETSDND